jgi:hypothetical protein
LPEGLKLSGSFGIGRDTVCLGRKCTADGYLKNKAAFDGRLFELDSILCIQLSFNDRNEA